MAENAVLEKIYWRMHDGYLEGNHWVSRVNLGTFHINVKLEARERQAGRVNFFCLKFPILNQRKAFLTLEGAEEVIADYFRYIDGIRKQIPPKVVERSLQAEIDIIGQALEQIVKNQKEAR